MFFSSIFIEIIVAPPKAFGSILMKYFTVYFNIFNQLNSNQIFGGIFKLFWKLISSNILILMLAFRFIIGNSIHDFSLY